MVDQRPSFSGYYERPLNRVLFRWIDHRKVSVIQRELASLPCGAVVIDVGCGSGAILERLALPGNMKVAGDHDLGLLRVAQARGLFPVRFDFDAPLPFSDGSVDAALMIDTIEHTAEPRHALSELHRVLRPGGVAIVFTPPYDSVRWILAERFHSLITRRPADHISPFTRESFVWALSRSFGDFRTGRVNSNLSMWAVARKAATG